MSHRHRVLVTDRFDTHALARLMACPKLNVTTSVTPRPTPDELSEVEALIIRSRTSITDELLTHAPRLRMIVTSTSGFDHIDLFATQARGITVMFTPEANAASAAELTWALVLACARRLPEAGRAVKAGDWARERLIGAELTGKTYGIVGLGRIGSRVARFARAFGMDVLAYDPYHENEHFAHHGAARRGLEELLRQADVVSLHVPLTPETRPLLHAGRLALLAPNSILVNTSRGQAIDESALVEALRKGKLGAVGLDVFEREPLTRASPLLEFDNVILSPHLGATTSAAFSKSSLEAAEKTIAYFERNETRDLLPGNELWVTDSFARSGPK